jgi:hypothetical protein
VAPAASYAAGVKPLTRSQIASVTSKMAPGIRSTGADGCTEDLGGGPGHVQRVADQAQSGQPPGNQPGAEQQRTQEETPERERELAELVGSLVRVDRERPERLGGIPPISSAPSARGTSISRASTPTVIIAISKIARVADARGLAPLPKTGDVAVAVISCLLSD